MLNLLEYKSPATSRSSHPRTPEENHAIAVVLLLIGAGMLVAGLGMRLLLAERMFLVGDAFVIVGLATLLVSNAFHKEGKLRP